MRRAVTTVLRPGHTMSTQPAAATKVVLRVEIFKHSTFQ